MCAAGRIFLKYIVFGSVVGAVIAAANFALYTIYAQTDATVDKQVFWLTFFISAVCGLLLAWAFTKLSRAGHFIMAMWVGFEIGAAASNLLYFIFKEVIIFWLLIITSSLVVALISSINFNYHSIWVTAIFGSYIFIVSFSSFYGRWPVDLNLPNLVTIGAISDTESYFYIYMTVWICMSALGVVFQCYVLWHYKKSVKPMRPLLQEAVQAF